MWQWELSSGGIFGAKRIFKLKATFKSKKAALRSTGNGVNGERRRLRLSAAIAGKHAYDGFFWTENENSPFWRPTPSAVTSANLASVPVGDQGFDDEDT